MNPSAQALLDSLIEQYDAVAIGRKGSQLPFSLHIGNDDGSIYVRRMVRTGLYCFANMEFEDSIRGQGVLTSFIKYIIGHQHDFSGIMVELIHNPRLATYLRGNGFTLINRDEVSDKMAPSLQLKFDTIEFN